MKKAKKLIALLLALTMILTLVACGENSEQPPADNSDTTDTVSPNPDEAGEPSPDSDSEPSPSGKYIIGEARQPDADGTPAKWTETATEDDYIVVTNEDGKTLSYNSKSLSIIQVDGYAFKDLDKDGELDVYEDWRLDSKTRAIDLAAHMSGEEIAPFLTHGGWSTFGDSYPEDDPYVNGGGRAGVARNPGTSPAEAARAAKWSNSLQALCEKLGYGIPALLSSDPNGQSGIIDDQALAATMDPDLAFEIGKAYAKQYRAVGISALLGPQIDLQGSPAMDRGNSTYGEDPALVRDITEAFVSGLQSTFDENGNDLGWGKDSVAAIAKHFAGAGAAEGGRDDHFAAGMFAVFPNNNFEAHLIAFFDGAFNLQRSSTGQAAGIMTNYSVAFSSDGSLGELVAGAYSQYKYDLLKAGDWNGYIVSDWGVWDTWDGHPTSFTGRGAWGTDDLTNAERFALAIPMGMCAGGGYSDLETLLEAYDIMVDELGEDTALEIMRDRAATTLEMFFNLDLFENPYRSTAEAAELCYSESALAYGLETQLKSLVMLKNDGTIKERTDGEKLTVYVPYTFIPGHDNILYSIMNLGYISAAAQPTIDIELAEKYFNVVTDSVKDPSGTGPDGKPEYTADDIIRASAADIASCDIVLAPMNAPHTDSTAILNDDGSWTYLPASLQYGEYTAVNAKETSVGGQIITTTFSDGYNMQTRVDQENRSYKGTTAAQDNDYNSFEMLQYAASVAGDIPVVVLMRDTKGILNSSGTMIWTEVEPLADVILWAYANFENFDEALLMTVAGLNDPSGLLVVQMPASMDAVEAQADDLPRDCEVYTDANGNKYDFAFGMNWSGVINDDRVQKYGNAEPLTKCENLDFFYANER